MKKLILIITASLSVAVVLLCYSSNFACNNKLDIEITDLIALHTEKKNIPYCQLLKRAIEKDSIGSFSFFSLEIYDGAAYDHAIIVATLVNYLGEDYITGIIESFDLIQRTQLWGYIEVGLPYTELDSVPPEDAFPLLYIQCNSTTPLH